MRNEVIRERLLKDKFGCRVDYREDLLLVGYARSKGWTVDMGKDAEMFIDAEGFLKTYTDGAGHERVACSGDSYKFTKGDQTVWYCIYAGELYWKRAANAEGVYSGHRKFLTLKEALDAP